MRTRIVAALAALLALFLTYSIPAKPPDTDTPKSRTFQFTYEFKVDAAPDSVVRIWFPIPPSDGNQQVQLKHISSSLPLEKTRDSEYGNSIFYRKIKGPKEPLSFRVDYQVTRKEYSQGGLTDLMAFNHDSDPAPASLARFLQPDKMVPINDRFQQMAAEITQGKTGDVEKAYAIYDYVFHTLRYDKTGTGWGRGDAMWACDSKHGNCTDFHSLFIALMRAEKIPARFEIGFPLPADKAESEKGIPGYHCWAEFYLDGRGWVPVDISEAWKNPARHDFFFGSLDANRVQFSVGRDLALNPPQNGDVLNYFVYPYVELDGKRDEHVTTHFAFRDLTPAEASLRPDGSKADVGLD
jgi:transglutaminase-like putative cysteine protease